TDDAGNIASANGASIDLDTSADLGAPLTLSAATATGGVKASAVSIGLTGIDSDIAAGTITLSDGTNTATHTLTAGEIAAGSVTLGSAAFTNSANLNHTHTPHAAPPTLTDDAGNTATANGASIELDTSADPGPPLTLSAATATGGVK